MGHDQAKVWHILESLAAYAFAFEGQGGTQAAHNLYVRAHHRAQGDLPEASMEMPPEVDRMDIMLGVMDTVTHPTRLLPGLLTRVVTRVWGQLGRHPISPVIPIPHNCCVFLGSYMGWNYAGPALHEYNVVRVAGLHIGMPR